jgi:hypothetical protein
MTNAATVPAPSDSRPSAVFLSQPSKLVLLAMHLGLSAADAIGLQSAQSAEAVRLADFAALLS